MERLHSILRRQLKRCFGSVEAVPAESAPFIKLVNEAYEQADVDRRMLIRSLDLSSEELSQANAQLQQAVLELRAAHRNLEERVVDRTKALEAAHERLRQAEKMQAIGHLAGGVAHDFNNELTIIQGCAELLTGAPLQEGDRVELDEIRKASQRAVALTHQLLAFSRRQVLEPKTVDLNQIVVNLQKMLARIIGEDITLLVDTTQGPAWVLVDPNQIEQVVLNLVVNARDALPQGGHIRLGVSHDQPTKLELLSASATSSARFVRLRISDDGVGMAPEVRDRIFEPFFTTKEMKGTGLGLASVYGIVHQSDGLITVDTAEGEGTTFTIFFPSHRPPAVLPAADVMPDRTGGRNETILLVEDEAAVRRVTSVMLQRHGYRVIEAASPGEADAVFREYGHEIHVLVTDVVMPEMDGVTLSRRLIALQPHLRVLFISGYADTDLMKFGLDNRNMAFLAKPAQAAQLGAKIRDLIGR